MGMAASGYRQGRRPSAWTSRAWAARPVCSSVVRGVAVMVPMAAALSTGVALSRVLPVPEGTLGTLGWYGAIVVSSMLAMVGVDRLARRLLPLAMLLRLSLVFP